MLHNYCIGWCHKCLWHWNTITVLCDVTNFYDSEKQLIYCVMSQMFGVSVKQLLYCVMSQMFEDIVTQEL